MKHLFQLYGRKDYLSILKIAYPLLLINATVVIMQLTDRKFLSMLSNEHHAAALPAGALSYTLGCLLLSTTAFATPMIAQAFGRDEKDACAKITWNALWFGIISGLITMFLLAPIGSEVIHLFDSENPVILEYELAYYHPLMYGFIFSYMNVALCAFFSGRGITWIPSCVQVVTCCVNIAANYALIFGKWGFPQYGMAGAAYGTVFAAGVGVFIIFMCFLFMDQKVYPTRKIVGIQTKYLFTILKKGIPAGLHIFTDLAAFTLFVFFVGQFGIIEKTSCTIAFSLNMIVFMPILGLNESASILVGQYYGKKMLDKAKLIGYQTLQMAWIYCMSVGVVYYTCGNALIAFFKPDESMGAVSSVDFADVQTFSFKILFFIAVYCFSDAIIFVCTGAMRGAGYTHKPMMRVAIGHWCIWVPLTAFLAYYMQNIYLVWAGMVVYLIGLAIAILHLYNQGDWLKPHEESIENPVFSPDIPA